MGPPTRQTAPFETSPAAGTPLVDVRLLFAEGRVVAVARVEPCVVRQDVEQSRRHVVDQRREVLRRSRAADSSGGQGGSGDEGGGALGGRGEGGCRAGG